MERATSKPRERYFRKAIIYFLTSCLMLNTSVPMLLAGPTGGVVDTDAFGGVNTADITYNAGPHNHTTLVDVHTDRTIIDWTSLDTVGGAADVRETLAFTQGALTNSAVLNRVSGAATQFNGDLTAAGMRIFVVNPAGIVFGRGSTVNVTQLVASGLNMSNDAFNAVLADPGNQMEFEGGDGEVENYAIVRANSVSLVGKKVRNSSDIKTPDDGSGLVTLTAGDNVYIAQDGSQVLVEVAGIGDGTPDVFNDGRIKALDGTVILAAGDDFSRAVVSNGWITVGNGALKAHAARVKNGGTMKADGSILGGGGSITLSGIEEVVLSGDVSGNSPTVTADGFEVQDGGTITFKSSEGSVNLGQNSIVSVRGGTSSGDGGHISISGEHFSIDPSSQIDASPGNTDHAPGKLEINTPSVIIADLGNEGAVDTIYEQDIETLSDKGTGLVVNSQQGITVAAITDGEIKGRYGNIELYATNADSFVTFEDATDTISTTLGDIIMGAGSGGLAIGNLETAKDVSDLNPTPGQIILSTSNRGNIKTGNLLIKDGWGHAEINVSASGELIVNGDVTVGLDGPILNIPESQPAEAMIFLKAGDSITLDGNVTASAHGLNTGIEGGVTKAYIGIFSGTNEIWYGDMTINGDLTAKAISSAVGTSDATIEIDSWGTLAWGPDAADPVADADSGEVHIQSEESASETSPDGDVAKIVVNAQGHAPTVNGVPDFGTTHMGTFFGDNVLDNDASPDGAQLFTQIVEGPKHAASFNLDLHGNYIYTPKPGFVGEDTFTYIATSDSSSGAPTLVTITITNTAPAAQPKEFIAPMSIFLGGSVSDSISDPDGDPLTIALVTDAVHGSVTMSPDGTFEYSPEIGFVGEDTFTYSVTDGQIGAEPVTGIVTMTLTNTPPVPVDDEVVTGRSVPILINVLANDADAERNPLKIVSFDYSGNGTIKINSDNTITYTSSDSFVGRDSFTYFATDGEIGGTPVEGTVTVLVAPITAPPPAYFIPTSPNLDKADVDISGCPALTEWAAEEIGVERRELQIWIVNGLASARGFQPCDACLNLRKTANILADPEGIYADAIGLIIDEFGSRNNPMTEELAAYITNAMSYDGKTNEHYARAEEYFDALSDYMAILHHEMGFTPEKSARIVARKYIDPLAIGGNVGVASYVSVRLDSVTTFLTVLRLSGATGK